MAKTKALFSDACEIIRTLKNRGYPAFITGGAVRDTLLGRIPEDYDIATTAPPHIILSLFSRAKTLGKAFGTTLVMIEHRPYQLTTLQTSDGSYTKLVEKDILRRDFTVNAMFWDPLEDRLVDIVGGMKDLKNRVLIPVSTAESIFKEDPIRMLRAVRLSYTLHFTLYPSVPSAIRTFRDQIHHTPRERIHDEWVKIFSLSNVFEVLCLLVRTRLLYEVIPEIAALSQIRQFPYHDFSVLSHTFRTLRFAEKLYHGELYFPGKIEINKYILMLACLLHDVGKSATHSISGGYHHFYGHEKIGADIAEKILKRLHFSKRDVQAVKFLVANHLYPLHLFRLEKDHTLTKLAIKRFKRKAGTMAPSLLLLSTADQYAKRREWNESSVSLWQNFCDILLFNPMFR